MTEPQALEAWLAPLSRVAAAALAGIVLGLNRDLQGKPVGVRTLGVVAVAACVLTYAAIEFEMTAGAPAGEMAGRAVQGLMAGIGFLGGGVILHVRARAVEGLTTAAMIWLTTVLGVACGLGAWHIVLIGAFAALLLVSFGGRFEQAARKLAGRPPERD